MTIRSISQLLDDFKMQLTAEQVSLHDVLLAFHERGFGFVLFIFALPMAMPLPVPPGINVLMASPLIILTMQQALGRHTVWLPKKMRSKTIETHKLRTIIDNAMPWALRLEILIKPRLGCMTQGLAGNIIGLLGLIMALTICIPLPLTNTIPSMGIALMAIGVIMRDGLCVLLGALIGSLWVGLVTFLALTLGPEGIDLLKNTIKSLIG